MCAQPNHSREVLWERVADGDESCLGELLDTFRNYLYLVARTQIDMHLAVRVSPSDVVQETFLHACAKYSQFRGTTEAELLAWIRKILVNNILSAFERHIQAEKRDIRRERPLYALTLALESSSADVDAALADQAPSPSEQASQRELAAEVADQISELPPHYREVIVLRNLEGLQFDEIAARMGRKVDSVRQLWTRGIRRLRLNQQEEPSP